MPKPITVMAFDYGTRRVGVAIGNSETGLGQALKTIKDIRSQINTMQSKTKDSAFSKLSNSVLKELTTVEEALHQTKAKSGQDVLNFPIRLDDKLAGIFESAVSGYVAPTKQVVAAYEELKGQTNIQLSKLDKVKNEDLKQLNSLVHTLSIPVIGN